MSAQQVHTFLAASVPDAVAQIRETLGPEAVVLNVRRLPAEGLARLWQKPRIEVLAHVPAPAAPPPAAPILDEVQITALADLRAEMRQIRESIQKPTTELSSGPRAAKQPDQSLAAHPGRRGVPPSDAAHRAARPTDPGDGEWRVGAFLEMSGLLPVHANRILDELRAAHGEQAPLDFATELELGQQALAQHWRPAPPDTGGPHVFIGAPGVGKTTALCKWLAHVTLVEDRRAAVWRLDSHVANTAESLSVFGEILGVPVARFAPGNGERPDADVWFVDLPGVNPADAGARAQLAQWLAAWPDAQVHLVLNAAYESSLLLAQARAFAAVPVTDVIVTHLDEEPRGGKIWNLVLGTNCSVRFLGAGQNIPGEFTPASAAAVNQRQFPGKTGVFAPAAW